MLMTNNIRWADECFHLLGPSLTLRCCLWETLSDCSSNSFTLFLPVCPFTTISLSFFFLSRAGGEFTNNQVINSHWRFPCRLSSGDFTLIIGPSPLPPLFFSFFRCCFFLLLLLKHALLVLHTYRGAKRGQDAPSNWLDLTLNHAREETGRGERWTLIIHAQDTCLALSNSIGSPTVSETNYQFTASLRRDMRGIAAPEQAKKGHPARQLDRSESISKYRLPFPLKVMFVMCQAKRRCSRYF